MKNIYYLFEQKKLYSYTRSKSLPMGGFKQLVHVKFSLDKCVDKFLRGYVPEADPEYLN